jgi:hypothetical protein
MNHLWNVGSQIRVMHGQRTMTGTVLELLPGCRYLVELRKPGPGITATKLIAQDYNRRFAMVESLYGGSVIK